MSTKATILDIADEIVADLNGLQSPTPPAVNPFLPFTFTAYRDYAPVFELKSMDSLIVVVCPRDKKMVIAGRPVVQQDDGIDIGIMMKPSNLVISSPASVLDPLMALVEQINDAIRFEAFGGSGWIESQNRPVYSAEHLRDLKQFTSVLQITLRRVR